MVAVEVGGVEGRVTLANRGRGRGSGYGENPGNCP